MLPISLTQIKLEKLSINQINKIDSLFALNIAQFDAQSNRIVQRKPIAVNLIQ